MENTGLDNRELVSIIIPVYNVKKYLNECVESVVRQSYSKIEIIIVDDGSSDGSSSICDNWEKRDSRIKVIHKQNGGVSSARNKGLDISSGQWIAFIDSDDWIAPNYIEKLVMVASATRADVVGCEYLLTYKSGVISDDQIREEETYNSKDYYAKFYSYHGIYTVVHSKIFRRKTIGNIRFKEMLHGEKVVNEDVYFTRDMLDNVGRIVLIPDELYMYRQREGSIMHAQHSEKLTKLIRAIDYCISSHSENSEFYDEACLMHYIAMCDNFFKLTHAEKKGWKKQLQGDLKRLLNARTFRFKTKIRFIYMYICALGLKKTQRKSKITFETFE